VNDEIAPLSTICEKGIPVKEILRSTVEAVLPRKLFERLRRERHRRRFGPKPIRFGDLRRTTPFSRDFGIHRGEPIDRYFIHKFLAKNSDAIRGSVLEIGDREYTIRFGGGNVTHSDVLHAVAGNPEATLVGDFETGAGVPEGVFDCLIITQTIHVIYRFQDALWTAYRALKPGGILLATFPSISQVSMSDVESGWGDYWRFTSFAVKRMLSEIFPEDNVQLETHGNILTAAAFLFGLSSPELTERELEEVDPEFVMLVTARAQKPLS
jgi:SAM-dependent methyltransferase